MTTRCCDVCGKQDEKDEPIFKITAQRVPRPSVNMPYIKVFSIDLCQEHIDYILEVIQNEMCYKNKMEGK